MKTTTEKKKARIASLLPDGVPKYIRIYDNGGGFPNFCRKDFMFFDEAVCPTCGGKTIPQPEGAGTADRYTAVFSGNYKGRDGRCDYIGMSSRPFHPQGVGMRGEHNRVIDAPSGFTPKLGDVAPFGEGNRRVPWGVLPPECKRLVLGDYFAIWDLGQAWLEFYDYESARSFRDPAWEADTGCTNERLKDGDRVTLLHKTLGDGAGRGIFGVVIPVGSEGVVECAHTPKVTKHSGVQEWSPVFANVDFEDDQGRTHRARIPHSAIKVIR